MCLVSMNTHYSDSFDYFWQLLQITFCSEFVGLKGILNKTTFWQRQLQAACVVSKQIAKFIQKGNLCRSPVATELLEPERVTFFQSVSLSQSKLLMWHTVRWKITEGQCKMFPLFFSLNLFDLICNFLHCKSKNLCCWVCRTPLGIWQEDPDIWCQDITSKTKETVHAC